MNAERVILWRGREGKGMPLDVGDWRTFKEDVLPGEHLKSGLFHLQLNYLGGMFDDFGELNFLAAACKSNSSF